jgi:hypothetical protein
MRKAFFFMLVVVLLAVPAAAQTQPVELVGVDGFPNGCDPGINVAGFTVRFNVPGEVTVKAQAYTDFYDDTVVIANTSGAGDVARFTMNAPELPPNTVVQYSISNGNPDTAVYVAVNCTTGDVYLQRLLGSDGRLFAGEDLPVVIYGKLNSDLEPFLDFYQPNNLGIGERVLRVDAETLAELPETPAQNIEIATVPGGLATLYKLTSGEYQVNYAPNEAGTVYVVIFDAISPTRIERADYP